MRNRPWKLAAIGALTCILSMSAFAQQQRKPKWNAKDLLPLTCAQAWAKANKSYPEVISIVTTLARVSLANRELTFPNTREAGSDAGKAIVEECKADPDALLFAIVDNQVRRLAQPAAAK